MASTARRAGLLRELSRPRNIVVGAQMLFVAFSGLVLVPVLMGLDASASVLSGAIWRIPEAIDLVPKAIRVIEQSLGTQENASS